MASDQQLHKWLIVCRCVLISTSLILSFFCVLSGVRPGWLEGCYILRIEAFQDVARGIVGTIPGLNHAIDAVWDEVVAKVGVPEAIAIYATGYCRENQAGNGHIKIQCSSEKASGFGVASAVQIALAVLYAVGITFSLVGMLFSFTSIYKNPRGERRHYGKTWTWIAFISTTLASLATAATVYALYMILSENLPEGIVAVRVGSTFFALTWTACMCLALGLAIMHFEEPGAEPMRHQRARVAGKGW